MTNTSAKMITGMSTLSKSVSRLVFRYVPLLSFRGSPGHVLPKPVAVLYFMGPIAAIPS
ncbi:MAG TPA: hypothetical protein VHZ03_25810 [Trebonia sp.]|nr:hypothetical protein [Trebonia sp.]